MIIPIGKFSQVWSGFKILKLLAIAFVMTVCRAVLSKPIKI